MKANTFKKKEMIVNIKKHIGNNKLFICITTPPRILNEIYVSMPLIRSL